MPTDSLVLLRQLAATLGPSLTGSRWDRIRRDPQRLREYKARRAALVGPVPSPAPRPTTPRVPALTMTREVVEAIRQTVGRRPSETGGALGGTYEDGLVAEYVFDAEARRTGATYSPNSGFLNRLFKRDWNPRGVRLLGFVHSHPRGYRRPSLGDEVYATRILEKIPDMPHLLLPLVMSAGDDGEFEILPFVAFRDGLGGVRVERAELRVVESDPAQASSGAQLATPTAPGLYRDHVPQREVAAEALLARVGDAYDLGLMARSRVVFVGAGGARAFAGDLVRAGVMEIVLIDGDVVSPTNVGTQHVYADEVGRSKVECVADELRRIHPNVRVRTVARMLDDELDDAALEQIVAAPFEGREVPAQILLCGFTDSFDAQARLHRFALTTGRPYLSGQVYREGRGIELVFTHPETTPACARCATRPRYESYERGFQNNVGSVGTPITATVQLNAMKGWIAMAILHHGTDHPRWGSLLARLDARTLVTTRLDPDFGRTIGIGLFDDALGHDGRFVFGETMWRPQKPDRPENGYSTCPECGGTGDLRRAIGTIPDTRVTVPYGLEATEPSAPRRFPRGPRQRVA